MKISRRAFVKAGSSVAALAAAGRLQAAEKSSPAGIAATPDHFRQQIDGFGFSEAFHQAALLKGLEEKDQNDLLNLMFSPNGGMGYSILRNEIGDSSNVTGNPGGTVVSIEPKQGEFNWTGDEDQIWLMNEAKKRGCTRFLSSAWSPPGWMKTNGDIHEGELKPTMYQEYADYLATYVLEYKKRYDLDIYAISPTNEPGFTPPGKKWESCKWNGGQLTKFLRQNLIPTFEAKGVKAEIVINENNNWNADMINEILSDPVCDKGINIVAAHAYAQTTAPYMDIALRTGQFGVAMEKRKRIWETEVSSGDANITNMNDGVYWARVLHTHMIEDNVSAWLYWWGAAAGSSRGSLITIDPATKKYQLSKRFFTIGQYSRFIRPGFHRVDANPTPAPHTFFSAYLDPTGKKLVCVAINDDAVEHPLTLQCGGFKANECVIVRTSNTETHAKIPTVQTVNGQLEVTTTPLSVTTFIIT